jgi:6,7-dimethyl-8-ribityllumazine synthase
MKVSKGTLDGAGLHVGIVVSRFNSVVTERLLQGAMAGLAKCGVVDKDIEIAHVPGAFEIPVLTRTYADSGRFDAIVCLGAVVRGETPHFEFISEAVVLEVARLSVEHRLPIALGVLTTNDVEQALARSQNDPGNKGYEAALTAVEMVNLRKIVA